MSNPIVGTYKDRVMRKYPIIFLRVSQSEWKKFIDLQDKFNLSEREVLELMSKPCPCSKDINSTSHDDDGKVIEIPRGILHSKRF